MTPFASAYLHLHGAEKVVAGRVACLVLLHNERNILPDFLRFYRDFGDIDFLIVDDRSDDGTAEYLSAQPDVTVFRPNNGSTYAKHKRDWRGEILDHYAHGNWVIVPDADERLIWQRFETRSFQRLRADLEAEGADALYCSMLDMYRDGPLSDQVYRGSDPLEVAFPLYDDPLKDPLSYRFLAAPSRFLRRWPTPTMIMYGGMRDRMFFGAYGRQYPWSRPLLSALPTIRDVQPAGRARVFEAILRLILKRRDTAMPAINLTKIPLLRWRAGMRFYGGAHAVSEHLRLARETGVLLHFPITRGDSGVRYTAERGQHTEGAAHYRAIVERNELNVRTLRYSGSSKYRTSDDLAVFIRDGGIR
ncbi:MAG: glycosyltransferase family 2 protein [Pseudomonadota bacterium]